MGGAEDGGGIRELTSEPCNTRHLDSLHCTVTKYSQYDGFNASNALQESSIHTQAIQNTIDILGLLLFLILILHKLVMAV